MTRHRFAGPWRLGVPLLCILALPAVVSSALAGPVPNAALTADGTWSRLAGYTPGPAYGMAAAYDPVRARTVVFGGWNRTALGGLFTLTQGGAGPHWNDPVPLGTGPTTRWAASMVYDSARDRMLVLGGTFIGDLVPKYNDVWALSLGAPMTWTQVQPAVPGPLRLGQVVIYDPVRDRVLAFGGYDGGVTPSAWRNDTWQLALGGTPTWTQVATVGTPPSARDLATGIYDPVQDRLVVFGGNGFEGTPSLHALSDTWALSLAGTPTWTRLTPGGATPPARMSAGGIFDASHDRFVVAGGTDGTTGLNDAYALDLGPTPAWSNLAPAGSAPTPRWAHVMVFDPASDRAVVLGGVDVSGNALGDVWRLDLAGTPAWNDTGIGMGPGLRESSAGLYDPARHRFVVFGGSAEPSPAYVAGSGNISDAPWNDLWTLSMTPGAEWQRLGQGSATAPAPRFGHLLALDSSRDRLVLFGGMSRFQMFNDVWTFDNAAQTWSALGPTGTPPVARYGVAGFYDAARDRLVLVGGYDGAHWLNDAWELDFTPTPHWAPLLPGGLAPPARMNAACAFDAPRDRLVIFGGSGSAGSLLHDTWALNFANPPTWINLSPFGQVPIPAIGMAAVVDPVRQRMVVFGGYASPNNYGFDAYALDLVANPPGWTKLAPGGSEFASPRTAMASAYDATNDRLVLLGGHGIKPPDLTTGRTLGDTWALTWGDTPTPTLLSLADYETGPGRVTLRWQAANAADVRATVERSRDASGWTTLGAPRLEGTDLLVYDDVGVAPGSCWYRLDYLDGGVQRFTDAVAVTVPAAAPLSLGGFSPNPAPRGAAIVFALPDARPARLELVDVRGRILLAREVGALGAGTHSVPLSAAGRLGAGVYWVRLVRPEVTLTRKGVVTG